MAVWEPLLQGVTWKSPPLFGFRASREVMVRALGAPHLVDQDSNGLGLFDAWALRFACGLEVCLWMFQGRSDGSRIEDDTELAAIEVHANSAHEQHLRFHLPVPMVDVSYWTPSPLVEEPLSWHSPRCEAEAEAARLRAARASSIP